MDQERADTIKTLRDLADKLERDPAFELHAVITWDGGSMRLSAVSSS